jgi:hypothetical protein
MIVGLVSSKVERGYRLTKLSVNRSLAFFAIVLACHVIHA